MRLVVFRDAAGLAEAAAALVRERIAAKPDLAMAVPAGRTPRRMYNHLRDWQAREPAGYSPPRVFSLDQPAPPPPAGGDLWRQGRSEVPAWAGVPAARP